MARLYVSNPTFQNLELGYRMIEHKAISAAYFKIPARGQAEFPFDVTPEDIDHLIMQWSNHGLTNYDDVNRAKGLVGPVYRIGKPVTTDQIDTGIEKNQAAATDRSEEAFTASGVGLHEILNTRAREEGSQLRLSETSVQQDFEGQKPKGIVSKGVRVERAS